MSKRGTEFIEQWIRENFIVRMPEDQSFDRRPLEWAQRCVSAAVDAGIPKEEIEEDFGDLEEFMEGAIADAADEKTFRSETRKLGQAKGVKRPRDANQLAKRIVDIATMDEAERDALQKKRRAARKPKKTHSAGKPGSSS